MSDNVVLSAAVGTGATARTKDRTGVETQIVALDLNPAGAETLMAGVMPVNDNSGSLTVDAPVGTPVFVRLSDGSAAISTLPVSVASLPLPSGAATETTLSTLNGKVPSLGQALAAGSVPVVLTAAQLTTLTPPAAITGFATSAKQDTGNTSLASIDGKVTACNTGAVVVSSGSVTVTNAGTFATQAAQSGTWTVQPGNTANTTAWLVTGTGGTFPVTGTFWQATQPVSGTVTVGNATLAVTQSGTWNVGTVSTVTSLSQWAGNAINLGAGNVGTGTLRVTIATDDANLSTIAANLGLPLQNADYHFVVFPTATTGSISVVDAGSSSTTNALTQTVVTGTATTSSSVACTLGGSDTVLLQISGNINMTLQFERSADGVAWTLMPMEQIGLTGTLCTSLAINENKTTFLRANSAGCFKVRVRCTARTSGTASIYWQPGAGPSQVNTNLSQVGGTAVATGHGTASGAVRVELPTDGTGIVNQGGTWTVQPGNTANTTPWLVTPTPATSGGLSVASYIPSGASNQDQTNVSGGAAQLYGYAIFNTTSSVRYVKIYNASAPTSASTPVMRLMVPASGGLNVDIPMGIAFGTKLSFRCTTGVADNDTGAVTTNDLLITLWYK